MAIILPNFFILGAAKAGTTTLADILRQHPQAYLPFDKEPMFFSRDAFYANGLDWYCRTFFGSAEPYPARGEASPHYLYWAEKVAPRIQRAFADHPVRFIILLRNPVERAYSWYWNMVREGLEDLTFEQALAAENDRLQSDIESLRALGSMRYGYVRGGQYADQISRYLELFERRRFLFLLQDDLRADFKQVCRHMFQFLEIDAQIDIAPVASNPASLPRSRRIQHMLQGPSALKELIKRIAPRRWRYLAKQTALKANVVKAQVPPMQPDTRRMLQDLFRAQNRRLSEIIARDLSAWDQP